MSPPVTVVLQVPFIENEQQFLLQTVQAALKAFRNANVRPGEILGAVSSTISSSAPIQPQTTVEAM